MYESSLVGCNVIRQQTLSLCSAMYVEYALSLPPEKSTPTFKNDAPAALMDSTV